MATRYPNAFFGYSGFVTAAPADRDTAPVKGAKVTSARANASAQKGAQGSPSRARPQTKAA